jgi:hypothetical protein
MILKSYEGALTYQDLKKIGYKDACIFFDYYLKIQEHQQQILNKYASV